MACPHPDNPGENVPLGGTACHNHLLYVCTVQGWRNTGAPCNGPHIGTVANPPPTSTQSG